MLLTLLLGQGSGTLQNYTLIADAGSFTLSGQAATLVKGSSLTASAGSLTITGQPATLIRQSVVSANAGSLAITGQPATLLFGRSLNAAAGSLAITGQVATTVASRTLSADAGALTVTGQAAFFSRGYTLSANAGSFAIAGQAAELTASSPNRQLAADAGTFTVTGQSATLSRTRLFSADSGSLSITGQSASLLVERRLNAGVGSFDILGQTASLLATRTLNALETGYSLDAEYTDDGYVEPAYFGGTDARLLVGRTLAADAGSIVITGLPATLEIDRFYPLTEVSMRRLCEIYARLELDSTKPVTVTPEVLQVGTISVSLTDNLAQRSGDLLPLNNVAADVMVEEIWQRLWLDPTNPVPQPEANSVITFGGIQLDFSSTGETVTVTRQ